MQFRRLRLAGVTAIFAGILVGVFVGWATPMALNPFVEPDMVGGAFFMAMFLVITPLFAYFEMVFFWNRSRFRPALKKLGQSPQIGMGIIAPASIGLAGGLALGWGLPLLSL